MRLRPSLVVLLLGVSSPALAFPPSRSSSPSPSPSASPPAPPGWKGPPPLPLDSGGGGSAYPPGTVDWSVFVGAQIVAGSETKGDNPGGGGAFAHVVIRQHDGWFTGTQWFTGALDSSTFGFDGKLVAGFSLGAFRPFGEENKEGPFARLGAEGIAMGNRELSLSTFEIPQLRVGGMFVPDADQGPLEVGVHTGPIFSGQFTFDGDAHRSLAGGYEVGPYASWLVAGGDLDLQLSATVIVDAPSANRGPVEVVRAMACAFVCIDAWIVHTTTTTGTSSVTEDSRAAFLGVALVPYPVSGR